MPLDEVILVNERDEAIGTMEKLEAHQKGLLHRAFSVFIINSEGKMLLQKRALTKYHSPGLWTNACCSHPAPGESTLNAAKRRLQEELGFTCELKELESFIYQTNFSNGLTEHEFDHILLGRFSGEVLPNPEEVDDYKWMSVEEIDTMLKLSESDFTFWFLIAFPKIKQHLQAV